MRRESSEKNEVGDALAELRSITPRPLLAAVGIWAMGIGVAAGLINVFGGGQLSLLGRGIIFFPFFLFGIWAAVYRHLTEKRPVNILIKQVRPFLQTLLAVPPKCGYSNDNLSTTQRRRALSVRNLEVLPGPDALADLLGHWSTHWGSNDDRADGLWRVIFDLYMTEERRDISDKRLATNIELYTALLSIFLEYYFETRQDTCRIMILTSLLPSHWWGMGVPDSRQRGEFYRYRQCVESLIGRYESGVKNSEALIRYIAVQETIEGFDPLRVNINGQEYCPEDKPFPTLAEVQADIKAHNAEAQDYVKKLHFSNPQARVIQVPAGFDREMKDLLVFGRERDSVWDWEWAIKSTLTPQQPTMQVRFHDPPELAALGPDFNGEDIYTFMTSLRKWPSWCLHGLADY